ncbi:MAG: hypothetical protein AB1801_10870 [Chloroflexota bacterium]
MKDIIETIILGAIIGVTVPLTLLVAGWFISASLSMVRLLFFPESLIPVAAFGGLGLGIGLDVFFLKRWASQAHHFDLRLLSLLYLFYAPGLLAFFMGVPVFNLGLGVIAGMYIGWRCRRLEANEAQFQQQARQAGLFTAGVMGLIAVISGAIALNDPWTAANLQGMFNLRTFTITPALIAGLVISGAPLLVLAQYWLARLAAIVAFHGWQFR